MQGSHAYNKCIVTEDLAVSEIALSSVIVFEDVTCV